MYISHINENKEIQTNEEHSENVASISESFAECFGLGKIAYLIGKYHDKGKEQEGFQNYIKYSSGLIQEKYKKVRHSYFGSVLLMIHLYDKLKMNFIFLSYPVYYHHTFLNDKTDFFDSIREDYKIEYRKEIIKGYECDKIKEILNTFVGSFKNKYRNNHIIRMLYSCLIDADRLDTERFMNNSLYQKRKKKTDMTSLLSVIEEYVKKFSHDTYVNKIRNEILELSIEHADKSKTGLYSMTVPTGGGKTISSVMWALHHAVKNNKKRIIIVIPYTSIITQTASVLKDIFGEDNVLEHHSDYYNSESSDADDDTMRTLGTENWDYPIIVTTCVQFYESIYSNKPGKCRKLHNICDSVVIIDEAQTIPTGFVDPILSAIDSYNKMFNVTFLITTASMPAISSKVSNIPENHFFLNDIEEIIPEKMNLYERLKRTEISLDKKEYSCKEIAERMTVTKKCLCIVNTKRTASEIYSLLPNDGNNISIHLSRSMCSAHIKDTINLMKKYIEDDNINLYVVSTQLIEAGVDIDFPYVIREWTGVDSIVQAAGRCNRNGKMHGFGNVEVCNISSDIQFNSKSYNASEQMYNSKTLTGSNIFEKDTMNRYFNLFYHDSLSRDGRLDEYNICDNLDDAHLKFKTAAEHFKLIKEEGDVILVNYKNSSELISDFIENQTYDKIRNLMKYSVTVKHSVFEELNNNGKLDKKTLCGTDIYVLLDDSIYDMKIGLNINNIATEEPIYII